jgi:hypothetical protein
MKNMNFGWLGGEDETNYPKLEHLFLATHLADQIALFPGRSPHFAPQFPTL